MLENSIPNELICIGPAEKIVNSLSSGAMEDIAVPTALKNIV
jgi:hypothetical protein